MNRNTATTGPNGGGAPVVDVDGGTLECVGRLLLLRRHVLATPPGTLLRVNSHNPIAEMGKEQR